MSHNNHREQTEDTAEKGADFDQFPDSPLLQLMAFEHYDFAENLDQEHEVIGSPLISSASKALGNLSSTSVKQDNLDSFNRSADSSNCGSDPSNRSFLLSTPHDERVLSEFFCILRSQIEVFQATVEDVEARLRKGGTKSQREIKPGRVGLRCIHCACWHPDIRPKGSTAYPTSTRLVYQAVRNFQRYHFQSCPNMPYEIKARLHDLKSRRRNSNNASVVYWEESCKWLDMIDVHGGEGICLRTSTKVVAKV